MHRLILGITNRYIHVDHKDRNGLNNTRLYLLTATVSQNHANLKIPITNSSGYKGVSFDKRRNLFRARVKVDGKEVWLGYFDSAEEASLAYRRGARKFFGEFARLK